MQTTQFELITPANQPDYRKIVAPLTRASWPEFMLHDPISDKHWSALFERFPEYQFGLLDTETNQAVAMGNSVPLHWEKDLADLPEEGFDWAFEQAVQNHEAGAAPNIQCAIQVAIHPAYQGRGLSTRMVQTMRSIGQSMGLGSLIAPVRPSQKGDYPLERHRSLHQLEERQRPAVRCMAQGARASWRANYQGLPSIHGHQRYFRGMAVVDGAKVSGKRRLFIPEALNPMNMNLERDAGVYVEPNVWMVHELRD